MAAEGMQSSTFNSVRVPGRGGGLDGSLRVDAKTGFTWKKQLAGGGGARTVEVKADDVRAVDWVRVTARGCMIVVRKKDENEAPVRFVGFRESDRSTLEEMLEPMCPGVKMEDVDASVKGYNWGELALVDGDPTQLEFLVDGMRAFEMNLRDVCKATVKSPTDMELELHHDDTTQERDSLIMASFHVPLQNSYVEEEEDGEITPAAVLTRSVLEYADVGTGDAGSPIAVFEAGCLVPRGRFTVEMYPSFMRMIGQTAEFKIQYASLYRMFILPKANMTQTYCIMSLDPPIRKGLTHYPHVMFLFHDDQQQSIELDVDDDVFKAINEKNGNKLQREYDGPLWEVFGKTLKGLSGAKLTRQGGFRSHSDGPAVRCSLKSDQGYLYALEKCFFYLEKPPTLIPYDDVAYVEFQRQAEGGSGRTIDMSVVLRDSQTRDTTYQFRGIAKEEHTILMEFLSDHDVKVLDPSGKARSRANVDADDVMGDEEDSDEEEEDEDFKAGADDDDDDDEGMDDDDDDDDDDDSDDNDSDGSGSDEDAPPKKKKK